MRVLVCGGRRYDDWRKIYDTLDVVRPTAIIEGGASGADEIAGRYADDRGIELHVYKAEWEKHGVAAGIIRNQKMLDSEYIEAVVAFPGGRGTADMVGRAKKAGIKVIEVK